MHAVRTVDPVGKLLIGQICPRAELGRALLRDAAHVVRRPYALQVGMIPSRDGRPISDQLVRRGWILPIPQPVPMPVRSISKPRRLLRR